MGHISDSLLTLSVLFVSGGRLGCEDAADANDNGVIDFSDAVFGLVYLFLGGPPPPPPGPLLAGSDLTEDSLSCAEPSKPRCFELF